MADDVPEPTVKVHGDKVSGWIMELFEPEGLRHIFTGLNLPHADAAKDRAFELYHKYVLKDVPAEPVAPAVPVVPVGGPVAPSTPTR